MWQNKHQRFSNQRKISNKQNLKQKQKHKNLKKNVIAKFVQLIKQTKELNKKIKLLWSRSKTNQLNLKNSVNVKVEKMPSVPKNKN